MNNMNSRVCARINLGAVEKNILAMKNNIPEGTRIMAVIKTDAYGHGAVEIGRFLEDKDYIWGYATATAEEAFELRDAGIRKPILVLGYTFPYAYERMLTEGIRPAVFRTDMAEKLSECGQDLMARGILKEAPPVHIAVDTGMSRIGITPDEAGVSFAKEVRLMSGIHIEACSRTSQGQMRRTLPMSGSVKRCSRSSFPTLKRRQAIGYPSDTAPTVPA